MVSNIKSRSIIFIYLFFWILITVGGAYLLYNIRSFVNFGIDLVGGTYLTLDVKIDDALSSELIEAAHSFIEKLKLSNVELPLNVPTFDPVNKTTKLVFKSNDLAKKAAAFYNQNDGYVNLSIKDNEIIFFIDKSSLDKFTKKVVENDILILRTRLDSYGAGEITIAPQGNNSIVVELPNISDPEQAKARIGKSATLEIKPIFDVANSKEKLMQKYGNILPEGTVIVEGLSKINRHENLAYLVPNYSTITGKDLQNTQADIIQEDIFKKSAIVKLHFKPEGAKKFYKLTESHIGEQLAIIIDNTVIVAPVVQSAISSDAIITFSNSNNKQDLQVSLQEAKELSLMLNSGSFSAPVSVVEERTIGPSLGKESISKGLNSSVFVLVLLFLFSIIVYKTAGILAFLVLIYNLLFILLGLALIPDATLTLPGIVGMVLTVGMAIDSSILIYEKIKEELLKGLDFKKAVYLGFSGALSVILDANITTFIVGAILYFKGSPAMQGFGLTMMIGIISTLVTGLILLRMMFNFIFALGIRRIKI
jgi:preprotein translocase subunit SecD